MALSAFFKILFRFKNTFLKDLSLFLQTGQEMLVLSNDPEPSGLILSLKANYLSTVILCSSIFSIFNCLQGFVGSFASQIHKPLQQYTFLCVCVCVRLQCNKDAFQRLLWSETSRNAVFKVCLCGDGHQGVHCTSL